MARPWKLLLYLSVRDIFISVCCSLLSNVCVSFVFNMGRDVRAGVRAVFGGDVKNIDYEKVET